jgi:ribosomal-protein-alanine N-acetyltransferase
MVAYPDPPLTNPPVELRRWSFDDLACIEEASTDPRIPSGTTVPRKYTTEEGRAFVERQWSRVESGEGVSLAIHSTDLGRAVGLIVMMLRPQPGVIGVGYWVVPLTRRQGIASRAVSLASTWALDVAGFARIEGWVEPDNLASQSVLLRAGFEREGRLRSFLATERGRSDVFVYSRVGVATEAP